MKVQKRGTNVKGHTVMWKIGGKWVSRKKAYELARAGKIDGVMACRGENGGYIQSHPTSNTRLYDLEEVSRV